MLPAPWAPHLPQQRLLTVSGASTAEISSVRTRHYDSATTACPITGRATSEATTAARPTRKRLLRKNCIPFHRARELAGSSDLQQAGRTARR